MLCSVAGKLRGSLGFDEEELFAALIAVRDRRCEDPASFTDEEVRGLARDFSKKETNESRGSDCIDSAVEGLFDRRKPVCADAAV